MRTLQLALLVLVLGAGAAASAQSVYADLEDGPDEDWQLLRDQRPAPTRPAAASPYELLPDPDPPGSPTGPAEQQWSYNGPHPVNADHGSGWCDTPGPHGHPYPPFDDHLFQETPEGSYNFLGDPADFGYSGDLYWYNGAHPIAGGWGIGWCFNPMPHRHLYRPFGAHFSACGPYACYFGPFDSWYWHYRPFWAPYWSTYYPRYYHAGRYYRTHVSASPGRFGRIRPGHHGAMASGARMAAPVRRGPATSGGHQLAPAGRPGGYVRPTAAARPGAPLQRSITMPHYGAQPRYLTRPYGRAPSPPSAMRGYPAPAGRFAPHGYAPPRQYRSGPAPQGTAPRHFSTPHVQSSGRSMSPPQTTVRPMATPRMSGGGGAHGFGGGRRR
jgi:hypothetical protein